MTQLTFGSIDIELFKGNNGIGLALLLRLGEFEESVDNAGFVIDLI
jgi:hypothetical protein